MNRKYAMPNEKDPVAAESIFAVSLFATYA